MLLTENKDEGNSKCVPYDMMITCSLVLLIISQVKDSLYSLKTVLSLNRGGGRDRSANIMNDGGKKYVSNR